MIWNKNERVVTDLFVSLIYHFDLSQIRGRSPIAHITFFLFTVNLSEIYVKSTEDMRERYFLNRRQWLLELAVGQSRVRRRVRRMRSTIRDK